MSDGSLKLKLEMFSQWAKRERNWKESKMPSFHLLRNLRGPKKESLPHPIIGFFSATPDASDLTS